LALPFFRVLSLNISNRRVSQAASFKKANLIRIFYDTAIPGNNGVGAG
jgi:hypothetical protein